jgi:beta-lactamase class A
MIKLFYLITILFFSINAQSSIKKIDQLQKKIEEIVATKKALVGVSIFGNNSKDTISLNSDKHFPLQSVFKFHIALAVLSQIDAGKFALDKKIEIQKKDLLPGLWSPLREENPNGGSFPISKLIELTVSLSDNVGCDALLRLIGGPKVVEDYFINNNINELSIKINEEEQQANWDLQYKNYSSPKSASETLAKFFYNKNNLLSKKTYDFIWKVMRDTGTGLNRLKGSLPKGTIVAHKTGSSGTNKEGLTAAVNDIGIVFLPNGNYFFISVFVTNSKENNETNEKIIAEIAKTAWDYFVSPPIK